LIDKGPKRGRTPDTGKVIGSRGDEIPARRPPSIAEVGHEAPASTKSASLRPVIDCAQNACCHRYQAMRGCILLEPEGKLVPFARAVCEAYWRDDQDISTDEVLAAICDRLAIDGQRFFTGIAQQAVKDQLRANTDELVERGGFRSPTIYFDREDMYFGNDRLRSYAQRSNGAPHPGPTSDSKS
jgi:2-hydroxychromene-2-carboxylate isomerase